MTLQQHIVDVVECFEVLFKELNKIDRMSLQCVRCRILQAKLVNIHIRLEEKKINPDMSS